MTKTFRSALAITALVVTPFLARAEDQPTNADLLDHVRGSVVQIVVRLTGGPDEQPPSDKLHSCFHGTHVCIVGTGIFVNDKGYVVTAAHVAQGSQGLVSDLIALRAPADIEVGLPLPNVDGKFEIANGTRLVTASILAIDPSHDLSLIRTNGNPFDHPMTFIQTPTQTIISKPSFVTFPINRPRETEAIFACGFPLGVAGLVTTTGTVASAWNVFNLETAAAAGDQPRITLYQVDLRVNPGNSGGPAFRTTDDAVIGIVVESEPGSGSLAHVVPSKFVTAFLDQQKVQWTSSN